MISAAADAWTAYPTVCDVCGRDGCEDHVPALPAAPSRLKALTLAELRHHQFPARPARLMRDGVAILRAGHLGEVFAERGCGKTWLLQTLALVAASDATALGFHAPAPCRVLYLDGEMGSEELQARFVELADRLHVRDVAPVTTLGADWQEDYLPRLDTVAGQDAVEPFVETADVIILDNRSCLFDPEGEKDPTAWQPAQDWLLSLRRRGKAVLMAHHANRQGGARGHSKSEDALNVLIKLARPDDYTADQGARFVVTFEKSRGAHGAAVSPFTARYTTADGWLVEGATSPNTVAARLLEYVQLAEQAGDRVKSASAAITGVKVNRTNGFKAWAELLSSAAIRQHPKGGFGVA